LVVASIPQYMQGNGTRIPESYHSGGSPSGSLPPVGRAQWFSPFYEI
jgi:hypothetical protein